MKRHLGTVTAILFLILICISCSSALAHDHIDSGEGYVIYSGYVAPTEDQDGSTGVGTCSVCGAVVEDASVIPSIGHQRGNNPPANTPAPDTPPPETDPPKTDPPPPDPTPVPVTPAPAADPPAPPAVQPDPVTDPPAPSVVQPDPVPDRVTAPPAQASTPVPAYQSGQQNESSPQASTVTAVPAPVTAPPTQVPTAVPAPVQPAGSSDTSGRSSAPTAQPTLPPSSFESGNTDGGSWNDDAQNTASGTGGGTSSGSGVNRKQARDLSRWPVFSSRFPWRRLRITPEPNIRIRLAGRLVWPLPEASSPLQQILLGP